MSQPETIEAVVDFHGHMCPGLAMGIKAAEVALERIGPHSTDEEVVAIVETDMCGVDAIQFLTGCTFGKGNLIHLDHGKSVFTFARRSDGKAVRVSARPEVWGSRPPEAEELLAKIRGGVASDDERRLFSQMQRQRSQDILEHRPEELFAVEDVDIEIPRPARVMSSIECDACGEPTMETRITFFQGRRLCRPCYSDAEAGRVPVNVPALRR